MPPQILPLPRGHLPGLSQFLRQGFSAHSSGGADFSSPAILNWKYFSPRGPSVQPRSMVLADGDALFSHIGICPTAFCSTDPQFQPVPALHMIDWLSGPAAGPAAGMLLMRVLKSAEVQYALGCTLQARRVLLGVGFREFQNVPQFHSVQRPLHPPVWTLLHGRQPLPRRLALLALDSLQSLKRLRQPPPRGLSLQPVSTFGPEITSIPVACREKFLFTSRDPALLNFLVAHPHGAIRGWHLVRAGAPCGFALTSRVDKHGVKAGTIADCFLDSVDPSDWAAAASLLLCQLRRAGAEVVSAFASAPWFQSGLRAAGFFRRGGVPLYLRDPNRRLPPGLPFHLTAVEGDAAYL